MKATAPASLHQSTLVALLDDELEGELDGELDGLPRHLWERALGMPARDFLSRPGKQFRAGLVRTSWVLAGGSSHAMPSELAHLVELLHAGSLIVDDIEDQAQTRREAPALHRTHGVPVALNTGNWMYFWALSLIDRLPFERDVRGDLTREACLAVERCHRGQALDIALRASELSQSEVGRVVRATTRLKTAALMELAAVVGGIALGAPGHEVDALRSFGRQLGEGLQMLDDLGGVTSAARAHKGVEDLVLDRPTWPWAWLAASACAESYSQYSERLRRVASGLDEPERLASDLGRLVADAGRSRVNSSLHLGLADLHSVFGDAPAMGAIRAEIIRLEESYE